MVKISVLGGSGEDEFKEDRTFWQLVQVGDKEDLNQDNTVGTEMRGRIKNCLLEQQVPL